MVRISSRLAWFHPRVGFRLTWSDAVKYDGFVNEMMTWVEAPSTHASLRVVQVGWMTPTRPSRAAALGVGGWS